MPKLQFHHSLHVNTAMDAKIRARAASFKSINDYITHCIRVEMEAEDSRLDREIAASVRYTIALVSRGAQG